MNAPHLQSAAAFLNALLRDWNHWRREQNSIRLELRPGEAILLPLQRFSATGRHEYTGEFFREGVGAPLSFVELVGLVSSALGESLGLGSARADLFYRRVGKSVDVITRTLRERGEELARFPEEKLCFLRAEQSLAFGHAFHPHPKSREEFSADDLARYSPELAGKFPLHWLRVPAEWIYARESEAFGARAWRRELFAQEFGREFMGNGEPFPVHPWQKKKILALPALARVPIEDLAASPRDWHPTSSLRTLYREDSPWMVKFSLSLRLTNSVRHLLAQEAERGRQVHDVFATGPGREFLATEPAFRILYEPAFAALRDEAGEPLAETMVVIRENALPNFGEGVAVLGALTQNHPTGGDHAIAVQVKRLAAARGESVSAAAGIWFGRFLQTTLRPLLRAQSELGVLLGAHQQNLLLRIEDHLPAGAVFRDCQGSGYSRLGFSRFGSLVGSITESNGNVLNERMGNTLFAYYLVINSAFGVISAMASAGLAAEEELLRDLRAFLENLLEGNPADPSCLNYLLHAEKLEQKGNFLCCLRGINENTTENPLAIYNEMPNPLRGLAGSCP